MTNANVQNGPEQGLAAYEKDLAGYLQERIKPGLRSSAIPLLARSIAKDLARRQPPASSEGEGVHADEERPDVHADEERPDAHADDEQPDFEAEMHELQTELGDEWILRFSVQGGNGWLTAESVEAPDAERLVTIVDAITEGGGRP